MSDAFDIRLADPRVQRAGIRPITVVSADSHACLPAREYLPYLDPQYREAAKVLIEDVDSFHEVIGMFGYPFRGDALAAIDGRRAIRNGGELGWFDLERRLRETEADGVVAEILHPGGPIGRPPFFDSGASLCSPELRAAGARAHNRFLTDFCSVAPERLLGVHCVYPWPDAAAAAERCREARDSGAPAIYVAQQAGVPDDPCPAFYEPFWDPFWAACEELDLVIHVHAG